MKAVAYQHSYPIEHSESLLDVELPEPTAAGRDLLVEVRAVSVNPVDAKMRMRAQPAAGEWQVLGWDATGVVREVGPQVSRFRPGDRVWYAGSLARAGSNAELQLVDERIVGKMPESLDFAAAAALPLTSITAWEMLFDRLRLGRGDTAGGQSLLIIGAGGGVGSIMTQLARQLTAVTVVGTASRPETQDWLTELGAHQVIDHRKVLLEELTRVGVGEVGYAVSLTHTDQHFPAIVDAIAPQGKFGLIDDPEPIDVRLLKRKSVSLHWELMFTRSLFETEDMEQQGYILDEVAAMVDKGLLRSTLGEHYGVINAVNLKRAHALLESGKSRGKIVLEGFR
jgi:zinc-binding alcohol dehydrogenase family protein